MGYKSVYKSPELQARLEQGYYDDIVEAGIQGGVFDADTQPTKGELDLQLAKVISVPLKRRSFWIATIFKL